MSFCDLKENETLITIKFISKVLCWVCLSQITIEAKADAKASPNHHSATSSKSSIIGNAVKPKGQMAAKGAKAQAATRRADIDSHGKNGFNARTIRTNFGDQQVSVNILS